MLFQNKNTPRWTIFLIDLFLAFSSMGFAYLLRFSFSIPSSYFNNLPKILLIVMVVRTISFIVSRVYSGIIRYTGTQDLSRIFLVNFSGSMIFVIMNLVSRHAFQQPHIIPYNIIIIDFFTLTILMTSYRMVIKMAFIELSNPSRMRTGVVVFGAGETGLMAKRAIERDTRNKQKVVAFIDDQPSKHRKKIDNTMIYSLDKLEDILIELSVEQVVIAVPSISPQRKSKIVEICLKHNIPVMSVPPVARWIDGELTYQQLKGIKIEELLGRNEIIINTDKISSQLKGKTIMVTGAAGSIGSELVRQMIPFQPAQILLLDQAETPLHETELEFNSTPSCNKILTFLCDITDFQQLNLIFNQYHPQIVFHAAAYKHVPVMENNPREAIKTNVLGTKNLADLSDENRVEKFIMISTDKAVNPTSVMGATKRMAEIYIQTLNSRSDTMFITTRFGNVLGSNGSVIPLFRKQIENGGPLTITHPKVSRFFMTIPEASRLVLEATSMGNGGEIMLFDMGESILITDLAKKMIKLAGLRPGLDIQIIYTGLRPGEKLFEELLSNKENTIHTDHPHILVARVITYDWDEIAEKIDELLTSLYTKDKYTLVKGLKKIIPEYKSQNSLFEQLDQN